MALRVLRFVLIEDEEAIRLVRSAVDRPASDGLARRAKRSGDLMVPFRSLDQHLSVRDRRIVDDRDLELRDQLGDRHRFTELTNAASPSRRREESDGRASPDSPACLIMASTSL